METDTFEYILKREKEMYEEAESKYGDFFKNASGFNNLLQFFIKEAQPDAWLFVCFIAQIKKHHTLALFSSVRSHHIQAMLNMRQVLEAGANAAYALANPKQEDFVDVDEDGILDPNQKLAQKRYKWLDENFPAGSKTIKTQKESINNSCAHSNLVYAQNNFKLDDKVRKFKTSFFDDEDEYLVKTDLWMLANTLRGLLDLFYEVNKKFNRITFRNDFVKDLKKLEAQNLFLKQEMMKHPRYVAAAGRHKK
jgi:hypothetical protein